MRLETIQLPTPFQADGLALDSSRGALRKSASTAPANTPSVTCTAIAGILQADSYAGFNRLYAAGRKGGRSPRPPAGRMRGATSSCSPTSPPRRVENLPSSRRRCSRQSSASSFSSIIVSMKSRTRLRTPDSITSTQLLGSRLRCCCRGIGLRGMLLHGVVSSPACQRQAIRG